jgi:hypothetical protein
MYTFSSKLKTFSIILMAVGILGIGYGFLTAPKDIQDVEKILAADSHGSHGAEAAHGETTENSHKDGELHEATDASHEGHKAGEHAKVNKADEHKEHLTHVLHQLQNKPWSALYVACIFFLLLSMGVLAFYAIQQVAQAGWSPVLFRVMQGITSYLPAGSIIFFIILVLCGLHFNHIFVWLGEGVTDPASPNYDEIIAGKSGYLNFPFWIIRAAIFLLGWNLYRHYSRKNCLAQDDANDDLYYKKNFKLSAGFLVFFIVSDHSQILIQIML